MEFEEQFPSLKHLFMGATDKEGTTENIIMCSSVEIHCLDKQRVKETIDKIIPLDENCATSMILNHTLKKELKLR